MNWKFLTPLLIASLAQGAMAQDKPEQFGRHFAISTQAAAPYYRLDVPLEAYHASTHGDLRDLRVFNASGQPVPFARLAASGSTEEQVQHITLHWFPVSEEAASTTTSNTGNRSLHLVVRQAQDGTLIDIRQNQPGNAAAAGTTPTLRGYILDASQVADRRGARSLDLDWDKAGGDFQLLDVESSDDLQHWQTLRAGVQLARLEYNGSRIENRRIDLSGFRDRYLRLVWQDPSHAPTLNKAELTLSSSRYLAAPLAWSEPLMANAESDSKAGEFHFHLPRPLPLTRLRIDLPAGNQLLPLEILDAARDRRYRRSFANAVVYRITNKGREWSNTEIPLSGFTLQDFVLRVDPRLNTQAQGPQIRYAVQPDQLLFLASGTPPYTLAVGNKDASDAALPPATLVPGFGSPNSPEIVLAQVVREVKPSVAAASAPSPVSTGAEEKDWKKIALWAVLVVGVLAMAGMAFQLTRQMNRNADEE